jgi:broad specificity phosphatase PhoE
MTGADTGPERIVLIRHAEKPLGDGPPHGVTSDGVMDRESLTPRGWQRAGALVGAFTGGRAPGIGLPPPALLVASKVRPESSSQRPLQTLQPLAERLGIAVDSAM